MVLKRILKIILLLLCIAWVLLLIMALYSMFTIQKVSFEYEMLVIPLNIIGGLLSIIFHVKTFKLYTKLEDNIQFKILWISNLIFGISLIILSLYLWYTFYKIHTERENMEYSILFAICFTPFLLGTWLLIEEYLLYKSLLRYKEKVFKDTIDDIKGQHEEAL